jgi:K+-sensing histidine kinase KdpD
MNAFYHRYRLPVQKTLLTLAASGAILIVTAFASGMGSLTTATTVAFLFLATITVAAYFGNLVVSVVVSLVATLCFDEFFLPPFGTLDVSSLGDWVSLGVFLLLSVVISKLTSEAAQTKAVNTNLASALGNLTALGRWLLSTKNEDLSLVSIAEETVRLFQFQYCSLHVYSFGKWDHAFGAAGSPMSQDVEARVQTIDQPLDWAVMVTETDLGVRYIPVRNRDQAYAVLAVKDEKATPETLRTIAYLIGSRLAAT